MSEFVRKNWPEKSEIGGQPVDQPPDAVIFFRDKPDELKEIVDLFSETRTSYVLDPFLEGKVNLPFAELRSGGRIVGLAGMYEYVEQEKIKRSNIALTNYFHRLEVASTILRKADIDPIIESRGAMTLFFKAPPGIQLEISKKDGTTGVVYYWYKGSDSYISKRDDIKFDKSSPLIVRNILSQITSSSINVEFSSDEVAGWFSLLRIASVPTEYDIRPAILRPALDPIET